MDHLVLFSEALKIKNLWYIENIEFDPLHHRLNIRINFKKGAVFEHYNECTKESTFYKAHITFDRFHIMKLVNEAVDAVRRSEVSMQPSLRKSRFALLKNASNLTQSQKKKRDYISQLNLKTSRALRMRDAFQEIYKSETIDAFTHALNEWYSWIVRSQLEPFKKLRRTIKKHMHVIVRWKVSQINNDILEALNSVVQAAKRKARGYGEKHFKIMAYFLTGKLNFKKFNDYLPAHFA